jgi:hypothetical protein
MLGKNAPVSRPGRLFADCQVRESCDVLVFDEDVFFRAGYMRIQILCQKN